MIVIFDLDYTLTRRGTWGRFVWRSVRFRPWLWLPLLFGTAANQLDYKRGRTPRGTVKKAMMRWSLMHRSQAELIRMGEVFARREVKRLRPGALAALARHRSQGDTVMIASAAACLIVVPLCRELGIDHYVCTEMGWDGENLSERFSSENCYADAKRRAVLAYLERRDLPTQAAVLYTDSQADFALEPLVDSIVVVNPRTKTRRAASSRGFEIVDWNEAPRRAAA